MISQAERRLKYIVTSFAAAIGLFAIIATPLGYFYISYVYESEYLHSLAETSAEAVSEFIYLHPDTWQIQDERLEVLFTASYSNHAELKRWILDNQGNVVYASSDAAESLLLVRTAPLSDGNSVVGRLEVAISLWPEIIDTLLVGLVSVLLGVLLYTALRSYSIRILDRTLHRLELSQKALHTEMQAKEEALGRAREAGEAMRHLALHDTLTGLPNRALFLDRLERAIIYAERAGSKYAVVMMDLDRFKEINDTLGHHIGDQLLQEISHRLQLELRKSDTISRLGGDEFAIILTVVDVEDAIATTRKLRSVMNEQVNLDNYSIRVDVSCGIAMVAEHGSDVQSLMQHADVAMYAAKRNGAGIAVYDVSDDPNSPRRLQRINNLREALDLDGLHLCYQPKLDLKSNRYIGVEALARWDLEDEGLIPPGEFIQLAEETGLIEHLTQWVLDRALQDCAQWQAHGLNIPMAVNLSTLNLHDRDLPLHIGNLLETHHMAPSLLALEITESAIMEDPVNAMKVLNELHRMGVQLSVDDFGTGYSSLAYLKELPLHEVKIDKSFVINMRLMRNDEVIVRSTIDLAHNLGLKVVAEGIEDAETMAMLREMHCDVAQGFHICPPLNADEVLPWLLAHGKGAGK